MEKEASSRQWRSTYGVLLLRLVFLLSLQVEFLADGSKCWGQAGKLDFAFDPGGGANGAIRCVYRTADGHIYIGGDFTVFDAKDSSLVARLNSNGSLDTSFSSTLPGNVFSLVQHPDGTVLVAGSFELYYCCAQSSGEWTHAIARLNAGGSFFRNDLLWRPQAGADGSIYSIAIRGDGRLMIGGIFSSRVYNLHDNGLPDNNTVNTMGVSGGGMPAVYAVAFDQDGNGLAGGSFTRASSSSLNNLARFNGLGFVDPSFNPGTGPNAAVRAIESRTDGRMLIGGDFSSFNNIGRMRIARLQPDGSIDSTFDPGSGADGAVTSIKTQTDGKVVVGGAFTKVGGISRNGLARLNSDGTLDTSFDPGKGANGTVMSIAIQPDGDIILVGDFTTFDGVSRRGIARVHGAAQPAIKIDWSGESTARISWPTSFVGFLFQKADYLPSTDWIDVTNNSTTIGGENAIVISIDRLAKSQFFRLIKQ